MGLLLSVLVACVGVIELITFYSNVRRNVTLLPIQGGLSIVRESYINELHGLRKRISNDLQKLRCEHDTNIPINDEFYDNFQRYIPTSGSNSHKESEVNTNFECNEQMLARSRSASPRPFLPTEKLEGGQNQNSHFPRRFIFPEEPQEQVESGKSPNQPRCVSNERDGTCSIPVASLSQFIAAEKVFQTDGNVLASSSSQKLNSHSEEYYRRSPSPYPFLELPHLPRNNIANDVVDNSVQEVDEELHISRSPSPSKVTLKYFQSNLKSASVSDEQPLHNIKQEIFRSSKSEITKKDEQEESNNSSDEVNLFKKTSYDEYLECTDGVRKPLKMVCNSKQSVKEHKDISANNSIEKTCSSVEEKIEIKNTSVKSGVLADVAEERRRVSPDLDSTEKTTAGSSKNEERKLPEPFWVNH